MTDSDLKTAKIAEQRCLEDGRGSFIDGYAAAKQESAKDKVILKSLIERLRMIHDRSTEWATLTAIREIIEEYTRPAND